MSAPPFPPQPSYQPVPPPPPSQAPGTPYYNPYPQYPGFPPAAPQPYDTYHPPRHDQNQPHHPHHNHNQGQSSSSQRAMYPRPVYSIPAKISNAIYVKNLPYSLSVDEFMSIFSKFGEIATTFTNKISTRGFAFVTYYDIRSAINAVEKMKDQKVHNRQPVTTFSFNPPEYSRLNAHETSSMVLVKPLDNNTNNSLPTDNQNTVQPTTQSSDQQQPSAFNSFFGASQNLPLDSDSVAKALSAFGEILKTFELGNNQFVVQYYDFRNARAAIASADTITINNQKVLLESYVEPDEGVYYENPPGYNPQSQIPSMPPPPPPGIPAYPPPYQGGGSPYQQHGNNNGGNRNNRNNRNNNHGNRHGNRPPQPPNNQPPFQPPPPIPPSYIPQQPQPLPPQISNQQPPIGSPSMPPQYSIAPPPPPPPSSQYQQGTPQMQYMIQYPQGIPPPPPPTQ